MNWINVDFDNAFLFIEGKFKVKQISNFIGQSSSFDLCLSVSVMSIRNLFNLSSYQSLSDCCVYFLD